MKLNEMIKNNNEIVIRLRKVNNYYEHLNKENEYNVFVYQVLNVKNNYNDYLYEIKRIKRKVKTLKNGNYQIVIDGVKVEFTFKDVENYDMIKEANIISFK